MGQCQQHTNDCSLPWPYCRQLSVSAKSPVSLSVIAAKQKRPSGSMVSPQVGCSSCFGHGLAPYIYQCRKRCCACISPGEPAAGLQSTQSVCLSVTASLCFSFGFIGNIFLPLLSNLCLPVFCLPCEFCLIRNLSNSLVASSFLMQNLELEHFYGWFSGPGPCF